MSKRLAIFKNSLIKKEKEFADRLENHFDTVKAANGQPLNDKNNGYSTVSSWNKQNDSLRKLQKSIQVTKNAIESEESKIAGTMLANETMPIEILRLVTKGDLVQWRKHPHIFFVAGVEKARIYWNSGSKCVSHRYVGEIKDTAQHNKFASVFNKLKAEINENLQ